MDNVERLLIDMKESLEREMRQGFGQLREEMKDLSTKFDDLATRLDRHGALLQTGSRWTNRMNGWAEKIDKALIRKGEQIAELSERIRKLEQRKPE